MEKNCTNCKYFSHVIGNVSYAGICNHHKHVGRLCTESTICSEYARDDSKPEVVSLSLYNKIANDILLEVKPVKLRKQIIPRVLELVDDEYQRGFDEGCEYVTKIEELAFINEGLQKQVDELQVLVNEYIVDQGIWLSRNEQLEKQLAELQNEYNQVLNQLLEARKPLKKTKAAADPVTPGQLTIFDIGETR